QSEVGKVHGWQEDFCSSVRRHGSMPQPKAGALMFACPRDCGANVLRLGFRAGTVSKFGRNAYHAFTEYRFYIAPTPVSARAYRIGRVAGLASLGLFSGGRC